MYMIATMPDRSELTDNGCFKMVSKAAKKLANVVDVTQAQEGGLSVADIRLATYSTMRVLLEKVTAIEARLGCLETSLAKRKTPESEEEDCGAPKSKKRKQGNMEGNETEGE
jgi:hypothetical protein